MKKSIFTLIIATFILSCSKNETNTLANATQRSGINTDYKKMAPYAEGTDELTGIELETLQVVDDSLINTQAGWQFYDSKFSGTAHPGLQQYIGYVVLSQKDIIGLAASHPADTTYQALLVKYVNALAETKYIGYCTLYHALKYTNDPLYRKTKAVEILEYAEDDSFQDDANSNAGAPEDILTGVNKNYAYIDSLTVMAH